MPNLTTIAEWAVTVGISRQSAYDAVKRCEIPVTDGKVDPEYASYLYDARTRKRTNGQRPDGLAAGAQLATPAGAGGPESKAKANVPGYETSRARREAAEAEEAELKLAERAGKFLVKADVEACLFEISRSMRDGLSNAARRIAADVAALGTVDECEAVIEREHRALLESMAQALSADLGVDVDGSIQ